MKCSSCGENNVENARFCAFCGTALDQTRHMPVAETTVSDDQPEQAGKKPADTAQPLGDNPFQPARRSMPHLYAERAKATPDYSVYQPKATPTVVEEAPKPQPARPVRPAAAAEKKVFLFDDEIEEEKQKKWEEEDRQRKEAFKKKHSAPDDELFYDAEEDEEYGEDIEEEDSRGSRVFIKVISVLTAVALVAAIGGFLFATSLGGRLMAQWGLSRDYEDYLNLAAWQEKSGSKELAADAYLNVFKLKKDSYDINLQVAYGFEACGDSQHAEAMYSYLIEHDPTRDEPYDHLMALLYTQGRLSEYEALLQLRAQKQPGFEGQTAYAKPVASPESGSYTGSIQLVLTAEKAQEIRYTLDDSQPTTQSFLYSGPITFAAGSYSVRAIAVYPDGRVSEEWSGFYSITDAG